MTEEELAQLKSELEWIDEMPGEEFDELAAEAKGGFAAEGFRL